MTYDIPALVAEARAALDPRSLMWDEVKVDLVRRLTYALDDLATATDWEYGLADGAGMLYGPADEATVRARQAQIIMPLRLMRRRTAGDWVVVSASADASEVKP